MSSIKASADACNQTPCKQIRQLASKKWLLFQCCALTDSVYGKLAAVFDLPPIVDSHFFPRLYLSSRHDASFPLRAITDTEAQTNKCAHMDLHMVYVHSRAYRASLFAERVLLTTKGTHGFPTAASTCRGRPWGKWAGRKGDDPYITNTPGLTLIVQHFNTVG